MIYTNQHSILQNIAGEPNLDPWIGPDAYAIMFGFKAATSIWFIITDNDLPVSVSITAVAANVGLILRRAILVLANSYPIWKFEVKDLHQPALLMSLS